MDHTSTVAREAHYQASSDAQKSLHMFFRAAKEYHETHRPEAGSTVQERRWTRSEFEARVICESDPPAVLRRSARILDADRDRRLARIRERRAAGPSEVLCLGFNAGGGAVIPFPGKRQAAEHGEAAAL